MGSPVIQSSEAAPKKNSGQRNNNNSQGQRRGHQQGRGHCDNQGNGLGHLFGNHEHCCHENDDREDREDRDEDDLVDNDCDDHHSHEDDEHDDDDGSGGSTPYVRLPGDLNLENMNPRNVTVTSGFNLSLGPARLSPSKVTHVTHGEVPNLGPATQLCPKNQVVRSTRLEFGKTRIICEPIHYQALDPMINEWAVGIEVERAEKIGTFSLLHGTLTVKGLQVAGAIVQYSTFTQSGMNAEGSDDQALCPRNEVMVGVQTIDSRFPFKRFLTTQAQPYCAQVIATPARKSLRAKFETPRDTSGFRRVIAPKL